MEQYLLAGPKIIRTPRQSSSTNDRSSTEQTRLHPHHRISLGDGLAVDKAAPSLLLMGRHRRKKI